MVNNSEDDCKTENLSESVYFTMYSSLLMNCFSINITITMFLALQLLKSNYTFLKNLCQAYYCKNTFQANLPAGYDQFEVVVVVVVVVAAV